jgi:hypothetical protein
LTILFLAALLALADAPGLQTAAGRAALDLDPGANGRGTSCAACHTTAGWAEVTFAHDRTGFPLTGRHQGAPCAGCHAGSDFGRPLARACSACHRDVHRGRMGTRCDDCHDTADWREQPFGPDAHRRTAFPLDGRHALLPCEECHGDRRDRSFSRPTPRCIGCHELDFGPRASAAGVDHLTAGFGPDCRECHGTWRFPGGRFAAHDACFQLSAGPHAGIACRACHDVTLPSMPAGGVLTCATDTADCLRCHAMPEIEARHSGVAGFLPENRRCYECHRFSGGG